MFSSWSVTPQGAEGTEGWLPKWAIHPVLGYIRAKLTCGESPDSLDINHLFKSQPLVRYQTGNVRDEASLTSSKTAGGPLGKPVLDWEGSNPNQLSPEKQSALHREVWQISWPDTMLRRRYLYKVWIHWPLTSQVSGYFEDRLPGALRWYSLFRSFTKKQTASIKAPLGPSTPSDASIRSTNRSKAEGCLSLYNLQRLFLPTL